MDKQLGQKIVIAFAAVCVGLITPIVAYRVLPHDQVRLVDNQTISDDATDESTVTITESNWNTALSWSEYVAKMGWAPRFQLDLPFGGVVATDGTIALGDHHFMNVAAWSIADLDSSKFMAQDISAGNHLSVPDCLKGLAVVDVASNGGDEATNKTVNGQVFCVMSSSDSAMAGKRSVSKSYTTKIGDFDVSFAGGTSYTDPNFTYVCGIGPEELIDEAECAREKAAVPALQDMSWFDEIMETFTDTYILGL